MANMAFVVCIRNEGFEASLEPRKLYQLVSDHQAATRGLVRVVDESGDDYLYPSDYFVPVDLPKVLAVALVDAA